MQADDEDCSIIDVSSDIQVKLYTAEDDFNAQKKTLFATFIWSGSSVLARELVSRESDVRDKAVIEFGAAAGLPSIVAGKLGARHVCATDFPSPTVLQTLQRNIDENGQRERVTMLGHIWGEDTQPLLASNQGEKFDVVLAAECLWKHDSHGILLQSVLGVIKEGGLLFISYSHHVPGLEDSDDAFVRQCKEKGFSLEETKNVQGKHMWSERNVDIILCRLRFVGSK